MKELQKQVGDLQVELEEQSGDDEGAENNGRSEIANAGLKREHEEKTIVSGNSMGAAASYIGTVAEPRNQKHDSDAYDHKPQQMEVLHSTVRSISDCFVSRN